MIEKITILSKSELKISKNKRTYFTIGDEKDRTFVCFKPALHPELEVGVEKVVDFTAPAKEGDSYKLNDIATEGEFPPKPDSASPPARKYGRDEDRVDQRTFVLEVGQDRRAGIIDEKHPFAKAREVILASWINGKVEKPFAGGGAVVPSEISSKPPRLTIDMAWLSESIKKIWPDKSTNLFAEFLIKTYNIDKAKSIDLMLKQLAQKQQADLSGKLTEMLEKL